MTKITICTKELSEKFVTVFAIILGISMIAVGVGLIINHFI